VLLKGPVIAFFVGMPLVTVAILDRSAPWLRRLKPLVGIAWLLLLTLPWFVTIIGRSSGTFLTQSVQQDFFRKLISVQESHFAPPLAYFVLFWVTFWPGATLVGMATPAVWAARREPGARFLLAWIVPAWIILELVPTKLPHYVLPLYPAIAILTAGIIDQHALSRRKILTNGARWWFVLATIVAVGVIAAHVIIGRQLGLLAWPFAVGGVVMALFAWWLFESEGAERSLLRAVAASVLLAFAVFGFTLPSLPVLSVAAQTRDFLRQTRCNPPLLASAGHDGPALIFLNGTATALTDGPGAADFLRQGPCRFALVESRHERGFLRRAEAIGLRYALGVRFEGMNLGAGDGGQRHSLAIYRSRETE
jgi:4-amino-4-deoxy-L-arabinose transferase-like glycosyltransferase